jgi:hypothetical protein
MQNKQVRFPLSNAQEFLLSSKENDDFPTCNNMDLARFQTSQPCM